MRRPPAVARVLERVTATAREHEMFLPGQTVLVAVSGGPDSVCLLESLVRLRRLFKIRLEVFHFDHRLREDSAVDAAYVARLAARHALPFHLRAATSSPRKGESVEAWAREQRHFAIAEVTRETGIDRTAIGHTLDDQAETVLMGLVTGSGIQGMSGIAPVTGTWVNPLLDVTREEIVAFCRSLHLRPRTDPTNADTRFLRNAIRLRGLPGAGARRGPEPPRTAGADRRRPPRGRRRADATDVRGARRRRSTRRPRASTSSATRLLDLPRAIAGRVVANAVYRCGVPCARADVLAVLDLAAGRPGRRRDLSLGIEGAARPGVCSTHSSFPGRRRDRSTPTGKGEVVMVTDQASLSTLTGHVEAYEPDIDRILITSEEIQAKLAELGAQIGNDYAGRKLLLVGVLKGAFVVMADLARYIRLPLEFDFMAVSSYGAATQTSGVVRILKDLDHDLEGLDVLLVEDIIDSGLTLNYLLKNLRARKPASLEVAALLRKVDLQRVPLDIRYTGFEIPNEFVVGYGLDYAERFRNLPYIATLRPEAYGGASSAPRIRRLLRPAPDVAAGATIGNRASARRRRGPRRLHPPRGAPAEPARESPPQGRAHAHAVDRADHGRRSCSSCRCSAAKAGNTLTTSEFRAAVAAGDIKNAEVPRGRPGHHRRVRGATAGHVPRAVPGGVGRRAGEAAGRRAACRTTPIRSSRTR